MCHCTVTPESGKPLFHAAYDLANLIGDCRAIAEALPAIVPTRVEELDLNGLSRIASLASVIGRLINQAEDLAYELGSDLHDLHRDITKGA